MPTDDGSEASSSGTPSRSPTPVEALAVGREKRSGAGNKLRALLDAEFQEEEIFAEAEDDEDFERAKSDDEEGAYLSDSSSDSEGAADEEEGERQLQEERERTRKAAAAKKRKAATQAVKPVPKRPRPTAGILTSKPVSTTSSVSGRRISFDPHILASRRSSRKLTVQITNETHERIISAAARRATLPTVPKREKTPPLTQEERLAQAVLTEGENKMSLQRIVLAEEERARKRREKLEALRRRRVEGPVWRFVSRRVAVEEVVPVEVEPEVEIVEDEIEVDGEGGEVKVLQGGGNEGVTNEMIADTGDGEKVIVENEPDGTTLSKEEKLGDTSPPKEDKPADSTSSEAINIEKSPKESDVKSSEPEKEASASTPQSPKSQSPTSPLSHHESEKMEIDQDHESTKDESTKEIDVLNDNPSEAAPPVPKAPQDESDGNPTDLPPEKEEPTSPKSPPPYELAHYTHNTLTLVPLPTQPILALRETFFPDLQTPPSKPKPAARCPITGLQVRYRDPLTGVGYYDIHAFAILREVARPDGRYVWCDEGGWFVGEQGPTGRPAKGVPDGWFG